MAPDDASRPFGSFPASPLREDEVDAFIDLDAAAFGARMSQGFLDLVLAGMSRDRVAVSRDSGQVVGSTGSEHTMMTVPGLHRVPTAMVVAVAVLPSHRRQGRLRTLMRYQLDDIRGRGEIAAALYASEGGIYGRFGYGPSTFGSTYVVDKRVGRLARPEKASGLSGCPRNSMISHSSEPSWLRNDSRSAGEANPPLPLEITLYSQTAIMCCGD